jgi:DMSO/TMAO reductase YedYZ molybdopterin-dependent catalytic subunit
MDRHVQTSFSGRLVASTRQTRRAAWRTRFERRHRACRLDLLTKKRPEQRGSLPPHPKIHGCFSTLAPPRSCILTVVLFFAGEAFTPGIDKEITMSAQRSEPSINNRVDRRSFLVAAGAALPVAGAFAGLNQALGQIPDSTSREPSADREAGLIVRQQEPENLEFPFATLKSFVTPNEQFYVRNHFPIPKLDPRTWRLKVEGAVERPLELTWEEVKKLPAHSVTATLECAGNNRAFLMPKAKGVPWHLGAVGNAEWAGVPLAVVLERAGLRDAAVEVVLEGADKGEIAADPKPPGEIHFARSLPLAKARRPEVLLAYRMNGEDLPATHGFPLRLIVPGWYGMASIKWLRRLIVTDRPFNGFFQSIDYSYFDRLQGVPNVVPVTAMQVKAQIARPTSGEVIKPSTAYRIHGAAWTGDSQVAKVEVSTDGERSWAPAKLLGKEVRYAWRLWEYPWQTPDRPGEARVAARATDAHGQVQPLKRDPYRRNYMISHVLPVEVTVK